MYFFGFEKIYAPRIQRKSRSGKLKESA